MMMIGKTDAFIRADNSSYSKVLIIAQKKKGCTSFLCCNICLYRDQALALEAIKCAFFIIFSFYVILCVIPFPKILIIIQSLSSCLGFDRIVIQIIIKVLRILFCAQCCATNGIQVIYCLLFNFPTFFSFNYEV